MKTHSYTDYGYLGHIELTSVAVRVQTSLSMIPAQSVSSRQTRQAAVRQFTHISSYQVELRIWYGIYDGRSLTIYMYVPSCAPVANAALRQLVGQEATSC